MPKPPRMPNRVIRVDDELWETAMQIAAERQESLAAVIRASLERYVNRHRKTGR